MTYGCRRPSVAGWTPDGRIMYATQRFGWWMSDMAGGFFLMGIVAVIAARLPLGEAARALERAVELRARLEEPGSPEERQRIETELAELRAERSDLAIRREQAFKRKMIMLGHLPPDDEVRLF